MPRERREWSPDFYYHVVSRGNRREPLFKCYEDFTQFFRILDYMYDKGEFELTSYCLMTNHFHLQLRSKDMHISKLMAMINKRYASYFNKKYELTGHVFEKRFYSKAIIGAKSMLDVSHYIHYNPVEANIVTDPKHYYWSSYSLYAYPTEPNLPRYINLQPILSFFHGTEQTQKLAYCNYLSACHLSKGVEL